MFHVRPTALLDPRYDVDVTLMVQVTIQRWSQDFEPVVKVDRMTKEVIQNEETKETFARVQGQGCA